MSVWQSFACASLGLVECGFALVTSDQGMVLEEGHDELRKWAMSIFRPIVTFICVESALRLLW